jgi:hypothetical protein
MDLPGIGKTSHVGSVSSAWGNDHGILGYALIKSPYPRRSDRFAKPY